MTQKPSYLGLLNAIAQQEWHAHLYLARWAELTSNAKVAATLRTVSAREAEHAMTFARRVNELGFEVQERPVAADDQHRASVATSTMSDHEKMVALGYAQPWDPAAPDVFDSTFTDHTIDPATGALLGRYIAEERDSERLLHGCFALLGDAGDGHAAATDTIPTEPRSVPVSGERFAP